MGLFEDLSFAGLYGKNHDGWGKTSIKFLEDKRVGIVYVFGSRQGIKREIIERAFPKASIHFQCSKFGDNYPWEPHRLVGETGTLREKKIVVFVNPWGAEDLNRGAFDAVKFLFVLEQMINEWGQRIALASCENNEVKPTGTYYRELSKPHMIRFRIKARFKELFGFSSWSRFTGVVHSSVV